VMKKKIFIGIIVFLGITVFVVFLAVAFRQADITINLAMHSPRILPAQKPQIAHQEFSIEVEGDKVTGWILNESLREPKTAIIFAPGYEGSKSLVLPVAEFFTKQGFVSVLFDPRGEGESDGEIYALGAFEDEDMEAIMDYVEENYRISQFVLFGYSCGATASIITAAKHPEKIVAVIADSPFANLIKAPGGNIGKILWAVFCNYWGWFKTGINLYKETNALAVVDKVAGIMFIHGKNDKTLSYSNSLELYRRAQEPKELWLIEGIDHVQALRFNPEKYFRKTLQFIQICLELRGP